MTTDPALSYHPTDTLVLPTKRRFFPFRIPNYHVQLRHYISTADRDRIYVVVDRVVYSIHISSRKREIVAVIPFDPKSLGAGYGWIAVGGTNNGECALVKLADRNAAVPRDTSAVRSADVDSALPIDLEASQRNSPETEPANTGPNVSQRLEVHVHKFGGSIVNSVTIHRLPGDGKGFIDEDVAVLSNNDKTVTIFSLTRSRILTKLAHPACMNYAIISPDSSILAAVGDEDSAYFYSLTRDLSTVVSIGTGTKVSGWTFAEILRTEMDIGPRIEDKCCFTIAFSQSNKLCAIGSQSGVISVFDVESIREIGRSDKSPIVCYFNSSRHSCSGGAVRCMSFSPEPWDLLVWLEDTGRAGIADVRQAFIRRQILELNMDEPAIEEVETEPIVDESMGLGFDLDSHGPSEPRHDFEGHPGDRDGEGSESPSREGLIQDVAERERFIMEVLNTARWTSRLEDGLTDRNDRSDRHRLSSRIPPPHPHMGSRARPQGATGGANRASRPTSPRPIILSQTNHEARNRGEEGSSTPDPQPSITLSWTTSPGELQSATLDNSGHSMESNSSDQSGSGSDNGNGSGARVPISRPSVNFDYGVSGLPIPPRPRNHQRSRSAHRRPERSENHLDVPHRLRANIVAIERLQRQRQLANEGEALTQNHLHQLRRHTQQYTIQPPPDHTRSPRWIRSIINEMSDHSYGLGPRNTDPSTSAGLGFGADGRTLYIATVMGIFEYQINVTDRKTFPVITYR